MRICVYGAGAGGGHFAVRLARAGHAVSAVARGATLQAIRERGLDLVCGDETVSASIPASADPADLGKQDLVLVTTKATALTEVAEGLEKMVGPETSVLFLQNGMPWWYRIGLPAGQPRPELPHFALEERFMRYLRPRQLLSGLIYSANEAAEPGRIVNRSPGSNRIDIGAVAPEAEDAVADIRAAFEGAGVKAPATASVRAAMWHKLLLNMSGSALALVTRSRSSVARHDPALGGVYRRLLEEGLAIAAAHGYPLDDRVDPETARQRLLDHRPSLLQDYEQGRQMEIGEILLAPLACARAAGVATPTLEAVAAIAAQQARARGLLPKPWG